MTCKNWTLFVFVTLIALLVVPMLAGAQPPLQGPEGEEPSEVPAAPTPAGGDLAAGFYYQGILTEGGEPVNGYRRMEFQLYDAASGGTQVGVTKAMNVPVSNGQFNVALDWDSSQIDGLALWLQVRAQDSGGAWRDLGRKQIRAVPYAMSLYPGARVVKSSGAYALYLKNEDQTGLSVTGGTNGVSVTGGTNGVYAATTSRSSDDAAVRGHAGLGGRGGFFTSIGGVGVYGGSLGSHGVEGSCTGADCYGGYFEGDNGIYGQAKTSDGYAGFFDGDVVISDELHVNGPAEFRGFPTVFRTQAEFTGPVWVKNIGWLEVDSQAQFDGRIRFTGPVELTGPVVGGFPRPTWNSGWVSIPPGWSKTLTHDVGGDPDDYFVDMQCRDTGPSTYGISNRGVGGDYQSYATKWGANYYELTSSSVKVLRYDDDVVCNQVRIRIWVIN